MERRGIASLSGVSGSRPMGGGMKEGKKGEREAGRAEKRERGRVRGRTGGVGGRYLHCVFW